MFLLLFRAVYCVMKTGEILIKIYLHKWELYQESVVMKILKEVLIIWRRSSWVKQKVISLKKKSKINQTIWKMLIAPILPIFHQNPQAQTPCLKTHVLRKILFFLTWDAEKSLWRISTSLESLVLGPLGRSTSFNSKNSPKVERLRSLLWRWSTFRSSFAKGWKTVLSFRNPLCKIWIIPSSHDLDSLSKTLRMFI